MYFNYSNPFESMMNKYNYNFIMIQIKIDILKQYMKYNYKLN